MNGVILAFDIGTSGLKASLVDDRLNVLYNATISYPTYHLPDGGCEQRADDWWNSAVQAMKELRDLAPEHVANVEVIGISGHMLGCLPMDAHGQPLRPSMIHADTRAAGIEKRLIDEFGRDYFYAKTGNVLSPSATLCKILWLKEHAPDIYAKTARILQSKDYLVYRLCGSMETTDYSDASHGMLINIAQQRYDRDIFLQTGLDAAKLPNLRASCELAGKLTADAAKQLGLRAGIPVSVGGGDGACACVGGGSTAMGVFHLCLGTTAWIAGAIAQPFIDPKHRVFHISTLDGNGCSIFGTTQCAGRSVNWARDLLNMDSLNQYNIAAEQAAPGSDGLIFLPYLEGERSPIFDAAAKGVFFGVTSSHQSGHFARAVFEGVAFGLHQILEALRERSDIQDLRIIGGGAKSTLWKHIIADICNVTLHEAMTPADSATALGAAAAAGVGVGMFKNLENVAQYIRIGDSIQPDQSTHKLYAPNEERYAALYPALKPLFHGEIVK